MWRRALHSPRQLFCSRRSRRSSLFFRPSAIERCEHRQTRFVYWNIGKSRCPKTRANTQIEARRSIANERLAAQRDTQCFPKIFLFLRERSPSPNSTCDRLFLPNDSVRIDVFSAISHLPRSPQSFTILSARKNPVFVKIIRLGSCFSARFLHARFRFSTRCSARHALCRPVRTVFKRWAVTDTGLPLNLYPDSFSIPLFTPPRRILMKHAEDIPMKKLRNGCRWRRCTRKQEIPEPFSADRISRRTGGCLRLRLRRLPSSLPRLSAYLPCREWKPGWF